MITNELLETVNKSGGRESWTILKENMSKGQDFYTTDMGKISFLDFIKREDGKDIAIFRSKSGITSYEYFYRELLCKSCVFLSQRDLDDKIFEKDYWKMINAAKHDNYLLHKMLRMLTDVISVEVTTLSESKGTVTQICNVEDVFESDNVGCIISVTVE